MDSPHYGKDEYPKYLHMLKTCSLACGTTCMQVVETLSGN